MNKLLWLSVLGALFLLLGVCPLAAQEVMFSAAPTPAPASGASNGGFAWLDINADGLLDVWIPPNNVLLNNTGGAYSAGSSSATNNKTTGSVSASYRLTSEDAAVGSIGTDISATDLDGVSRSGTASKGCYEYA